MTESQLNPSLPERVGCLILPLRETQLAIPITAIAEVVNPLFRPDGTGASGVLYGWISWRERTIPVLSYEALCLNSAPTEWKDVIKIAVINTVGKGVSLGYFALALSGNPRPFQASMETPLFEVQDRAPGAPLMELVVDGAKVPVPDFEYLETMAVGFKPPH